MIKSPQLPSVSVEVGASAHLEVRAEVPPESMGRLLDALTDAIRPFTEARGLRAEHIRLQREEVLLEIAKRAALRRQLDDEGMVPVPTRILVPLLERASLESPADEEMIDRWAELLSNASRPGSIPPRMLSLLSELNGEQARLLAVC